MKKTTVLMFATAFSMAAFAESEFGPWRFSAGPAWRSRVKATLSGSVPVPSVNASHTVTYDKDITGTTSWNIGDAVIVQDPDPFASPGDELYAITSTRTETTVTPGASEAAINSSDEESPLGLKLGVGYDFYENGTFSVGFDFKFAAYWDMESAVSGSAAGGSTRVQTMKDYFLFTNGPYPPAGSLTPFLPETDPYIPYRESISDTTTSLPSQSIRAMVTSDLYQLGIGPRFGWNVCNYLDAYAGVSALCNIAAVDFDVNGCGESATECRFGVGADVGLAAWVSENIGFYAEVGYEWIDEPTVRNGGMAAELDYSSLIVSTGLMVRF
jgi:hypothetical protein